MGERWKGSVSKQGLKKRFKVKMAKGREKYGDKMGKESEWEWGEEIKVRKGELFLQPSLTGHVPCDDGSCITKMVVMVMMMMMMMMI